MFWELKRHRLNDMFLFSTQNMILEEELKIISIWLYIKVITEFKLLIWEGICQINGRKFSFTVTRKRSPKT